MDLIFYTEARFIRRSSRQVYSVDGGITLEVLQRYLACFTHVYIVARVLYSFDVAINSKYEIVHDRISFIDLPYYVGPFQYLRVKRSIRSILLKNIRSHCAYICRVPGQIGSMIIPELRKRGLPYGVEVVGDPWDVFAPGAVRHPLRIFFRYKWYWNLKQVVKAASAVLYVTEHQLQMRYPASQNAFQISASNVQIIPELLSCFGKVVQPKVVYTLLAIGSLEQMYKAPDIVLQAMAMLRGRGVHCRLVWLGEGCCRKNMEQFGHKLGVGEDCVFMGNVSKEEVYHQLNIADIFLMVSRTEGLPRALIEAMAIGLPCIGSEVGGIPELLSAEVLVPKENAKALCDKIEYMIHHIDFMRSQAKRNFKEAKKYYDTVLREKRTKFYQYLISISQ